MHDNKLVTTVNIMHSPGWCTDCVKWQHMVS